MPRKRDIKRWADRVSLGFIVLAALIWFGQTIYSDPIASEDEYEAYQQFRLNFGIGSEGYADDLDRGPKIVERVQSAIDMGAKEFQTAPPELISNAEACFEKFRSDVTSGDIDTQRARIDPANLQYVTIETRTFLLGHAPHKDRKYGNNNSHGFFVWDANDCTSTGQFGWQSPRQFFVTSNTPNRKGGHAVKMRGYFGALTSYRAYIDIETDTILLLVWEPDWRIRLPLIKDGALGKRCKAEFRRQYDGFPDSFAFVQGTLPAECIDLTPSKGAFRLNLVEVPAPYSISSTKLRRYVRNGHNPVEHFAGDEALGGDYITTTGISFDFPSKPAVGIETQDLVVIVD